MQFHSVLNLSIAAAGAVVAETFVSQTGGVPAAGANVLGVARAPATAAGQLIPVDVLGTAIVASGGAFNVGDPLQCDVNGNAVVVSTGKTVARALMAATAAGQRIEVILIPN